MQTHAGPPPLLLKRQYPLCIGLLPLLPLGPGEPGEPKLLLLRLLQSERIRGPPLLGKETLGDELLETLLLLVPRAQRVLGRRVAPAARACTVLDAIGCPHKGSHIGGGRGQI